jgi:hypothetical protein
MGKSIRNSHGGSSLAFQHQILLLDLGETSCEAFATNDRFELAMIDFFSEPEGTMARFRARESVEQTKSLVFSSYSPDFSVKSSVFCWIYFFLISKSVSLS